MTEGEPRSSLLSPGAQAGMRRREHSREDGLRLDAGEAADGSHECPAPTCCPHGPAQPWPEHTTDPGSDLTASWCRARPHSQNRRAPGCVWPQSRAGHHPGCGAGAAPSPRLARGGESLNRTAKERSLRRALCVAGSGRGSHTKHQGRLFLKRVETVRKDGDRLNTPRTRLCVCVPRDTPRDTWVESRGSSGPSGSSGAEQELRALGCGHPVPLGERGR